MTARAADYAAVAFDLSGEIERYSAAEEVFGWMSGALQKFRRMAFFVVDMPKTIGDAKPVLNGGPSGGARHFQRETATSAPAKTENTSSGLSHG